jgi:GNAT superfamily N-acetyltransferase
MSLAGYATSERRRPASDPAGWQDRAVPAVRRCPPSARADALATVLDAFAADPLLRWIWPADDRYAGCAPAFFGLLLDLRLESGEVWLAGDGDAAGSVAMWDPPGGLYQPIDADARWAAVQKDFTAGERAAWAFYDHAMGVPKEAGPHWYLGVLATAPHSQGTGLGRAVTAPMLAAADRTALPAYLETASETNVAIYRRLGFEIAQEVDMPDSGPRCWLMSRAPQAVAG